MTMTRVTILSLLLTSMLMGCKSQQVESTIQSDRPPDVIEIRCAGVEVDGFGGFDFNGSINVGAAKTWQGMTGFEVLALRESGASVTIDSAISIASGPKYDGAGHLHYHAWVWTGNWNNFKRLSFYIYSNSVGDLGEQISKAHGLDNQHKNSRCSSGSF